MLAANLLVEVEEPLIPPVAAAVEGSMVLVDKFCKPSDFGLQLVIGEVNVVHNMQAKRYGRYYEGLDIHIDQEEVQDTAKLKNA